MAGINLAKQIKNRPTQDYSAAPSMNSAPDSASTYSEGGMGEFGREEIIRLIMVLVGVGIIYGAKFAVTDYTQRITDEKQAVINKIAAEVSAEQAKLASLKDLQAEEEAFNKRVEELQKKLDLVESVSRNRNTLVRMVDFAVTEMPRSVWLSQISVDLGEASRIELQGRSTTMQLVSEYLKRLEGAVFFPDWQLVETENLNAAGASAAPPTTGVVDAKAIPQDAKRFTISAKTVKP